MQRSPLKQGGPVRLQPRGGHTAACRPLRTSCWASTEGAHTFSGRNVGPERLARGCVRSGRATAGAPVALALPAGRLRVG